MGAGCQKLPADYPGYMDTALVYAYKIDVLWAHHPIDVLFPLAPSPYSKPQNTGGVFSGGSGTSRCELQNSVYMPTIIPEVVYSNIM